MATTQEAVRRLRIEVTGDEQAKAKLGAVSNQQTAMAVSAANASKATAQLDASMSKSVNQYDAIIRQQAEVNRLLAANVISITATSRAANDNNRSISESGLEWAEWTNHIKTAGEAAYALSPRFRGLVNSLAGPAVSGATTAIEVAATGVVRSTNLAGKGLIELGAIAARTSTSLAPFAEQMAVTGAAMAAWNPTLTTIAATILGKFLPAVLAVLRVVAPILLVKDAIDLLAEAWTLGGQKLESYRQIAAKAAAVDLSTSYFQKITKAANDAKIPVDELTGALKKLGDATTEKLGGSDLQQQLDKHLKAGNFQGNSGVGALGQANTTEERFRAVVSLIDQAMQKGERLAALDISNTAFGPQVTENLRKDSEYLDRLLASADKVSDKDIISDADVGRALDLQRRYDAAVTILEQRWHPIQDLLTQLGIKMQETWVGIVEAIAKAVDGVIKLGEAIFDKIPAGFWDLLSKGIGVGVRTVAGAAIGAAFGPAGIAVGTAISAGLGANPGGDAPAIDAKTAATNKLAAGLKNANAVTQAAAQTNAVYNAVLKDTSHTIDDNKKKHEEADDAVDRAINSVNRHIEQQKADAQAIGLGAAALAEFRVQAAETAAVQANGGKETADQAAKFAKLREEAGAAADALARAKIDNTISRGEQTRFLSPEDVTIANQLKDIYPDVATALGSVEASGLRANTAITGFSSTVSSAMVTGLADMLDGTKSLSQGFGDMSKAVLRALEEMLIKFYIVMPIFRSLQLLLGGVGGIFGFSSGGLVDAGSSANPLPGLDASDYGAGYASGGYTGAGGKYQPAGIVHAGEYVFNQTATARLGVSFLESLHRGATRGYDVGGLVTPSGANVTPFYRPANENNGDVSVVVHNNGAPVNVKDVQQVADGRGGRRIELTLDDAVATAIQKPGSATQGAMRSTYQARKSAVKR